LDILNNSISIIGLNATKDLRARIVRYYLADLDLTAENIKTLKRNLKSDLLTGLDKGGTSLYQTLFSIYPVSLRKASDQEIVTTEILS